MKGCRHTNAFPCVSLLCLAAPESRSRERSLNNLSPYRPRNQEAGRGGTVRRVHTLRCRRSRAAVPLRRESSRSRGNVREPPKHNEACRPRKLGYLSRRSLAGPSIYKIGFANLAGSGAGSTVSSFWRASTPPTGSLTISETTTLETL
jgi:hypothetical protein